MRVIGMIITLVVMAGALASAATVNLNDGSSIQGKIIKQDDKSLQIDVDGVTMTYYADEIKDVDGTPLAQIPTQPSNGGESASQPEAAAQPVAVTQPEGTLQPETAANTVSLTTSSEVNIDPDKKALILKFIDVFGTRQALINNFDLMLKQIEKDKPEEAQKIRQRVKIDEIIERLLPIYDRNFTSDDLNAFIAFYGSAEGQKLISTIPELMKESVQESVKYMEEKFPEVKGGQ